MKGNILVKSFNTENFYYSKPKRITDTQYTESVQNQWMSLVITPAEGRLKYKEESAIGKIRIYGEAYYFIEKSREELLNELQNFKEEKLDECRKCEYIHCI